MGTKMPDVDFYFILPTSERTKGGKIQMFFYFVPRAFKRFETSGGCRLRSVATVVISNCLCITNCEQSKNV